MLANEGFANLRDLTLRGLCATEEMMQTFLEEYPHLRRITLHGIDLASGSWEHIFAKLSQMKELKLLRLSCLTTPGNDLVNLEPRDRKLDTLDRETYDDWYHHRGLNMKLWHTREIDEEELRRGLAFRRTPGGGITTLPVSAGEAHERLMNHITEFGPPTLVPP
jgi:hypothetical protein